MEKLKNEHILEC